MQKNQNTKIGEKWKKLAHEPRMKGKDQMEAKHREIKHNQASINQIPIIDHRILKKLKMKWLKSRITTK
jgi:hypothetical protein